MTLCISLCICRLTLAWISSEISTKLLGMPTHLDRSSLTAAGLYLMWPLSQMSGVDSQPPLCVFRRQLTSLTGVPFLLPVASRSRVQNPLSSFAPKQTKGSSAWRTTYIVSHLSELGSDICYFLKIVSVTGHKHILNHESLDKYTFFFNFISMIFVEKEVESFIEICWNLYRQICHQNSCAVFKMSFSFDYILL